MSSLQPVRGTHDLLPEEMRAPPPRHRDRARGGASATAISRCATPIFEFSEVFKRTLGDTSDIVTKEMYSFTDRGGEQLTLRPEGTASVARALISEGLAPAPAAQVFLPRADVPLRAAAEGPHAPVPPDRRRAARRGAAAGRCRDHRRRRCASCAQLGVLDRTVLELNTLGDSESRQAYRKVLVDYLGAHKSQLVEGEPRSARAQSAARFSIRRTKATRRIVANAPLYSRPSQRGEPRVLRRREAAASTRSASRTRSIRVWCAGSTTTATPASSSRPQELGAQSTVMAGGRYDGLVEMMGGPPTPGVGWASGIERVAMMLADQPTSRRVRSPSFRSARSPPTWRRS